MFKKILIANRGEIACRVIKTARQMGISTVAIYSSADKTSQQVEQADEAYYVGEAPAKSSYLNIDAIIAAAKQSGAQAIHPGYGFLSENPLFAKACADADIVFIGPSIDAMEAMASKQLAKQRLENSNVPLTPGYHGSEQSDEHLLQEASRIGFPILLKAASGGGGKGMRAVHEKAEFFSALAGARREATASFADDTMIIEKLVLNPRHIEVQIMADNHGNVVHLYERDCSIQRRHQKIIEEAPAPLLHKTLGEALTKAACDVARSIDYRGAGTVEFLVDNEDNFYFMEMNTRLQVEHPVTELITGQDLVAWQIQIAANQPLPCQQEDINATGHAIECRIYAEDPYHDFLPSTGQLTYLKEPTGTGIRIDTGVTNTSIISQYYDPMIAKLIAWGGTREQALQRLQQALSHYFIGGVKSNIPFLQAICKHPRFINANLGTDFLTRETITLISPNPHLAVLMAVSYDYLTLSLQETDPLFQQSFGWKMHVTSAWQWHYRLANQRYEAIIYPINAHELTIEIAGEKTTLRVKFIQERLIIDDGKQQQSALIASCSKELTVYSEQGALVFERLYCETATQETNHTEAQLTAPMPSTVVAILKQEGDIVVKGEPLIVLEAMKMEHTIRSPKNGNLIAVFYAVGAQVNEGAELLRLE